jgi:hypothetical protein
MTLDVSQVYGQIEAMVGDIKSRREDFGRKLDAAATALEAAGRQQDLLRVKIDGAKTTWLVAGLKEGILNRYPAGACPKDYVVAASDGSHIDVDRHQSARLFLLNTGLAALRYGSSPGAEFYSSPRLYFGEDMLAIRAGDGRQVPVEGPLLGIMRTIEEFRALAGCLETMPTRLPAVGLTDGSLILWGLAGQRYEEYVARHFLEDGLLKQMDRFYGLSDQGLAAVVSYISFPRSADVVNVLRLQMCPYQPVDCDRYCAGKYDGRPCDQVGGLADRDIFGGRLADGERSAMFCSRSSVNERYGLHSVCFFYVRVGDEIARLEVPAWVADRVELLDFVHALTVEQCRKGFGYPVALSEAHEQAVVTGADRVQFWEMVQRVLEEEGVETHGSMKQRSKRTRWI